MSGARTSPNIPVTQGFFYLVAVMDWATRHVLSWRLSNTMDTSFCTGALDDALIRVTPEILNTVQGAQFTSEAFAERVLGAGVAFSMDGRGRFLDNIFIERLWRSLKYEAVYLHELRDGLASSARGSTSTTRCARTRRWADGRRARPTATARGRHEQPASRPVGRCRVPAGSRPSTSPRTGAHTPEAAGRRHSMRSAGSARLPRTLASPGRRSGSPPGDRGLRFT